MQNMQYIQYANYAKQFAKQYAQQYANNMLNMLENMQYMHNMQIDFPICKICKKKNLNVQKKCVKNIYLRNL